MMALKYRAHFMDEETHKTNATNMMWLQHLSLNLEIGACGLCH
jgi:hypothetical protein